MSGIPPLRKELLHELFVYEPDTGRLYWKTRPISHFGGRQRVQRRWNTTFAGRWAGSPRATGARRVVVNGVTYSSANIVWHMHNPPHLTGGFSHIDGDDTNDRLSNIKPSNNSGRPASVQEEER